MKNAFVIALLLTILVAYLFPQLGDFIPLKTITDIGIGFIFFFYGLKLSLSELKQGMRNYKLHTLIQLSTFLVFPLLILMAHPFFNETHLEEYWFAFFFLAVLPSTVSSSVVMVSIAKGNIPAAIFNASISGIIGVFLTPIWLELFFKTDGGIAFNEVLLKLLWQIVLPLILGFLLRHTLRVFVNRYKNKLGLFDKSIIALIVYESFSKSFKANVFSDLGITELLLLMGTIAVIFLLMYSLTGLIANGLGFNRADKITAQFCGTKKSLVHGSVMAKVIFAGNASAGLFLLPIMLYHIFQLIVVAILAEKQAKSVAN